MAGPADVMAGPANAPVWRGCQPLRGQGRIARLTADAWQRLRAGAGSQGPRLYDWVVIPLTPPLDSRLVPLVAGAPPSRGTDRTGRQCRLCPRAHPTGGDGPAGREPLEPCGVSGSDHGGSRPGSV
jgi:hypothetical protein